MEDRAEKYLNEHRSAALKLIAEKVGYQSVGFRPENGYKDGGKQCVVYLCGADHHDKFFDPLGDKDENYRQWFDCLTWYRNALGTVWDDKARDNWIGSTHSRENLIIGILTILLVWE